MKIAYVLEHDIASGDGVARKLLLQAQVWRSVGHDVEVFSVVLSGLPSLSLEHVRVYRKAPAPWPISLIRTPVGLEFDLKQYAPDVVYMRYAPPSGYMRRVASRYPVIVEMNTRVFAEICSLGSAGRLKQLLRFAFHAISHRPLMRRVRAIVGVTNEILGDYRTNNASMRVGDAVVPNAIDVALFMNRRKQEHLPSVGPINVFLVGSARQPWHGTDKLITAASRIGSKIHLHLIGTGDGGDLPPNVTCYPFMNGDALEGLLAKMHVGVSTLALHRKNMNEACPLKSREYLARGFPMIYAYDDPAMVDGALEGTMRLPNTERNVEENVEAIAAFCERYRDYVIPLEAVAPLVDIRHVEKRRVWPDPVRLGEPISPA